MKCPKCGNERNEKDDNFCRDNWSSIFIGIPHFFETWVLQHPSFSIGEQNEKSN